MRRRPFLLAAVAALGGPVSSCTAESGDREPTEGPTMTVHPSGGTNELTLHEALSRRRSVRAFGTRPVTYDEVTRLLWAAQGVTHGDGLRTAPSAGALYPLTVYAALPDAVYRYDAGSAQAVVSIARDVRPALGEAALAQSWIGEAGVVLSISGDVSRTATRYAGRAERYLFLEAGHVAQNILLEAVALGLAGTPVGAFDDDAVGRVLALPSRQRAIYLLPVGQPA